MGYRRKLVSAALLAGAVLLLLAWVAQAQQEPQTRSHSAAVPMAGHGVDAEPPRGNDPAEEFPNASSADPSPPCFPARWHRVSALIVWPVAAIVRRAGSRADAVASTTGHPRVTAAAVIALSVAFWWSVGAAAEVLTALLTFRLPHWLSRLLFSALVAPDELGWLADEVVRYFGYYPWVLPLFFIPYLTAAATLYALYLSFRSWRKKWWSGLGRVHYSIVAITLAWYPFQLAHGGFFP